MNLKVRSGSAASGLTMSGASGEFGFQLYGNGSGYNGFLDAECKLFRLGYPETS